jgi:hypothetical protein
VTRRPLLAIVSILATLSLAVAACSSPAAPALSDPTEILAKTVESMKGVTTVQVIGSLTGELQMAELGGTELDLSTTTIAGIFDIPNQKGKLVIDAPSLLGTKLEALVVDGFAYIKVTGPLAGFLGVEGGKYMKQAIPEDAGEAVSDPSQVAEEVDKARDKVDELPTPEKLADEKCGDQDCYHIRITADAADLQSLSPEAGAVGEGTATIDIWSRKSDLRPAKIQVSVTSAETGTIGVTFDLKYDVPVDVSAPPADQVTEMPDMPAIPLPSMP